MNCPLESGGNAGHLLDYAAGKLKAEARAQMERHIAGCPACRAFAGGQQAVWQALEAWEPAAVSMDFDRRLYARIDQQASWWTRLDPAARIRCSGTRYRLAQPPAWSWWPGC
jgi:anti-sigma factor RsiW